MTKQEYEARMAESQARGFNQTEMNYRIALRDSYIASLEAENQELNEFLCPQEKLDFLLEFYGGGNPNIMTPKAAEIHQWMVDNVIKPKAELEQHIAVCETALVRLKELLDLMNQMREKKNDEI